MTYHTRNCTTIDDPTQGSAFHELVVLPTLAPRLARPYRVPGTDVVYNMEFSQNTQGNHAIIYLVDPIHYAYHSCFSID